MNYVIIKKKGDISLQLIVSFLINININLFSVISRYLIAAGSYFLEVTNQYKYSIFFHMLPDIKLKSICYSKN